MIKRKFIAANICVFFAFGSNFLYAKSKKENIDPSQEALSNSQPIEEDKSKLDNPNIDPVDIISQSTVWFELHLEERQNTPFFTTGKEISRHIIQAVLDGKLTPYKDEMCTSVMSKNDFLKNLRDPSIGAVDDDADFNLGAKKADSKNVNHLDIVPSEEERFRPKDLSVLVFKTRIYTDIIRSNKNLIVDVVTIRVPAKRFQNGIQRDVASFKFEELQAYFDTLDEDDCWMCPGNEMGNLKFSDAFRNKLLWFPQVYEVLTDKMKMYGLEPDPNKPLNLKKSDIITQEAHLWVY